MKTLYARGFTLIELLVVIAIIGLLSSVVLASLNSARAKGRDARRLSDLKQMASQMAVDDNGMAATTFVGCTATGSRVSSCTTPNLTKFLDPSNSTVACTKTASAACDYRMETASGDTQNYQICAYLETKSGPLSTTGGMVYVGSATGGSVLAGCP